jgi:LPS sulfotransferase NodH
MVGEMGLGRLGQVAQLAARGRPYLPAIPGRTPRTRFVVLASPRTGSELLVTLLNSHPQINCDSELFKEPRLYPRRYVMGCAARRRADVYGFKLIDSQLRWQLNKAGPDGEFLTKLVAEEHFKVIYLRRRDLLAQALSFVDAARSSYHFREDDAAPAFEPLQVDPAELISLLHGLDDNARWIDNVVGRVPHLRLTYEDDLKAADAQGPTVERICAELGIAPAATHTDLVARAPAQAAARIANPDEVATALRTTRFAPLAEGLEAATPSGSD